MGIQTQQERPFVCRKEFQRLLAKNAYISEPEAALLTGAMLHTLAEKLPKQKPAFEPVSGIFELHTPVLPIPARKRLP